MSVRSLIRELAAEPGRRSDYVACGREIGARAVRMKTGRKQLLQSHNSYLDLPIVKLHTKMLFNSSHISSSAMIEFPSVT